MNRISMDWDDQGLVLGKFVAICTCLLGSCGLVTAIVFLIQGGMEGRWDGTDPAVNGFLNLLFGWTVAGLLFGVALGFLSWGTFYGMYWFLTAMKTLTPEKPLFDIVSRDTELLITDIICSVGTAAESEMDQTAAVELGKAMQSLTHLKNKLVVRR